MHAKLARMRGSASAGELGHDTAPALAGRLGTQAVSFPGGHSGFTTHPIALATERLHDRPLLRPRTRGRWDAILDPRHCAALGQ